MAKRQEIYKCDVCGNIIEVIEGRTGELICCNQPMKLLEEKTADSATEKHVPFVKREGNKYIIRVGENAAHPMEENHYIQWIEIITDQMVLRKYLTAGDRPEAVFEVDPDLDIITVREHCNVHGLWVRR